MRQPDAPPEEIRRLLKEDEEQSGCSRFLLQSAANSIHQGGDVPPQEGAKDSVEESAPPRMVAKDEGRYYTIAGEPSEERRR